MTIVDDFILTHYKDMTISEMAARLGVTDYVVMSKKRSLERRLDVKLADAKPDQEIMALINLIETRKSGWAVEVAKQRIIDIEKNKYNLNQTNYNNG